MDSRSIDPEWPADDPEPTDAEREEDSLLASIPFEEWAAQVDEIVCREEREKVAV